jgi:CheY-like chemotaxis protein
MLIYTSKLRFFTKFCLVMKKICILGQPPSMNNKSIKTPSPNFPEQTHILVAEDDAVNQQVISVMLKTLNVSFTIADDGIQALNNLKKNLYSLVLMDCQMPNMDGYQTTKYYREYEKDQQLNRIPIIAFTAFAIEGEKEKCLDIGMDDFMTKPATIKTIERMLTKWLIDLPETNKYQADSLLTNINDDNIDDLGIIDQTVFDTLLSYIGADSTNEIIALLLKETPKHLNTINNAIQQQDYQTIQKTAHRIKSGPGNLGALKFSKLCANLELDAKNNHHYSDIQQAFSKINEEWLLLKNHFS